MLIVLFEIIIDKNFSKSLEHFFAGKPYAHEVVRTDSREQKLDVFFSPSAPTFQSSSSTTNLPSTSSVATVTDSAPPMTTVSTSAGPKAGSSSSAAESESSSVLNKSTCGYREIRLTSVLQLRDDIKSRMDEGMYFVFFINFHRMKINAPDADYTIQYKGQLSYSLSFTFFSFKDASSVRGPRLFLPVHYAVCLQ